MDNVIGMLSNLGATLFDNNKPFTPDDLKMIKVTEVFRKKNPTFYNLDEKEYKSAGYSCLLPIPECNFLLPTEGPSYNEIVTEIYRLFQDYYFVLQYVNCYNIILPVGLLTVSEPINLCFLANINNNDFTITQERIFPFELSEEKVYIVINIEKSEEDLCVDNTFQTVSIIDIETNNIETYIRIVFENKRWSDWMKYKEDVFLNINFVKLITSFNNLKNYLVSQLSPTNNYEIKNKIYKTCYSYHFDERNIFILDNEYIFNYNLDTKYKLKNVNYFEINFDFSLSSYISFVNSVMNNITYIPSNDLIEIHHINKKSISE